jgi:nucleoside-diphosphate-sugar epimerase
MRVVVIGATGNAGTSVLEALAREDRVDEVVGVARRAPQARFQKVTWRKADISDPNTDLADLMRGAGCVVHLAWLIQPSRDESVTHATNVEGSQRVFDAVAAAGVPALVYASSVGAYAPGPKDRAVDESWPTTGIQSSFYSRHKAAVERILDSFEAAHPDVRVVRLRPGLIFKRAAATGIRRLFAGPFLPSPLVRPELIKIIPSHPRLVFQAVHSLDVGEAYRLAIVRDDARGAYNVAADPVLDSAELARTLDARPIPVPAKLLRAGADVTWRLRLQPTSPGWVDMGLGVPVMDTTRARTELGWTPRYTATEALLELIGGMHDGAGEDTPPLSPQTTAPARVREVLTGVGRTSQ